MFQNRCAHVMHMQSKTSKPLKGEISVPGDKSISHRSIMFGAIADGTTHVKNFLQGADCLSTISCFRKLGIQIENDGTSVLIHGRGLHGLQAPSGILDVGNSGTTIRLISGILAGQNFASEITGDASIQKRPMDRIITPLRQMGADIASLHENGCAPLRINSRNLNGTVYHSPVSSAQVKSCILLAGLYADGQTTVTEPALSRNHTELMLQGFGAHLSVDDTAVTIFPDSNLHAQDISVPGDISSAAYFIAAGLIVPGSEILLRNVGVNPTRAGILTAARQMGGDITLFNERFVSGEPVADILVKYSFLHGTTIAGSMIPTLIDEIPIIAVMAAAADGQTVIRDAGELKVKESNRIDTVTENLTAMGADITATEDGMIINKKEKLHSALIRCHNDHRIAMSFAVAGLTVAGGITLDTPDCVHISYPTFYKDIDSLKAE